MTINEIQDQIVEEFSVFNDWMDRYSYLIELGNGLQVMDEKYKVDQNLIKSCQSRVWVNADLADGKIVFTADSDAIITKGIIALLIRVLSNQTPKDIMNANLYFIDKIGLKENLSPTRANGLVGMVKQMRDYAIAYNSILANQ
ncbi:MAG: SufE family protein [Prevotellaceae bacterium]|nr:SufE family protein [Prevotellaceae bacterium]